MNTNAIILNKILTIWIECVIKHGFQWPVLWCIILSHVLAMPETNLRVTVWILATLIPIQLPVNVPGKAEEAGLNIWIPAPQVGNMEFLSPGLNLTQPKLLQTSGLNFAELWFLQSFEECANSWNQSLFPLSLFPSLHLLCSLSLWFSDF